MKVVITCKGETLKDRTDPRFARCPTFLIVDTESLEVEAIPNQASSQTLGASLGAAKQLAHRDEVNAVITGQVGPNAVRILENAGISVHVGARGTAREALKAYRAGRLSRAPAGPGGRFGRMRLRGAGIARKHFGLPPHTPVTRKGRGTGRKSAPDRTESDRSGVPPTSGFHAGAEPGPPEGEAGDEG